jgi:HlyD family secretion protein
MNAKSDIESADRNVEEKAVSLQESRNGADALDIKSAQLTVTQRQNALRDAYEELAEYTVCAPIAGVIASVAVQTGGTAGSGSAVATLVTKQKIAEVALNEIDITSVKTGQKVNLTFDAVDGLTITGSVAEVDQLGTSSQGVVSYTVKIGFDTDDERIKANMSVTAAIITEARQDVLLAPNSAVKTQGEAKYVQTLNGAGDPENKSVEVGLSNDTMTEIISGLNVGDEIITQTINPANTSSTSQSGTGLPGFSNGGGNRNFGSGAGQTIKIPGGGG